MGHSVYRERQTDSSTETTMKTISRSIIVRLTDRDKQTDL